MTTSEPQAGQIVHVGRQPLYNPAGDVVGYELLFRGGGAEVAASRRNAYATSQVIVNAFTEFGLPELVGNHTCFINLTREFIVGELALPFEPGQVVLEILETVEMDDEVIAGVTRLVEQGYPIALDDFVFGLGHERLLDLASYVKIDVLDGDVERITSVVEACRQYPGIKLVAEKVETAAHTMLAHDLGFELYQGYALSRTQVVSIATLAPSRLRRLELLGALTGPETDIDHVVSIVTSDPALTFRVLRATNAASGGLSRRISSVHEAVVMLGGRRIREWVTLMLVSDISEASDENLSTAMARARLCQTIAAKIDASGDAAFIAGLLWGISDVLGVPVAELVGTLPLADEVTEALVHGVGPIGEVVAMVRAYEGADTEMLSRTKVSPAELAQAYLSAVGWSVRTVQGVLGPSANAAPPDSVAAPA
ncbi:EAL and HDOD domain-containing protein [Planosporangium sp. 12N6]|uniref:EAL and HDOD domain-containing protein n=1 Tax=Planosporangium spinosum TaxID=3402278 RepID=UPI003CF3B901